jgi:hypothetical protein
LISRIRESLKGRAEAAVERMKKQDWRGLKV